MKSILIKDTTKEECEEYFYAHMLNIDGKIEAAKEFGKKMADTIKEV